MPDELPAETGGAVETPQDQPSTDWEKRYTETHAWGNKLNEELASERKVWDDEEAALARLAEKFPHLFEDDQDDDEEIEPEEAERPLTRAEFEEWKRDQAASQQQQTAQQMYEADLQKFLNGRELDEFADRAIRNTPVKNADELKAVVDNWFEKYGPQPKERPRVPHTPTTGQTATQVPDWSQMSRGDINRLMAEQVLGSEAQT